MVRFALILALVGAAPGCGLIDPDIADFDLSLPPKEFVVDTEQWGIQVTESTFPDVDCSGMPGVCSAGATELCVPNPEGPGGANCFASCNDSDSCEVLVQVDLWTTVNLAIEKPELAEINNQPIVSVSIEKIWFDVLENTMNIDAPEMNVYVAPSDVMSSGSPQALQVGTIPVIAAGQTLVDGQMNLTPEGEEHLRTFMKDYKTPFNIIVGGVRVVQPGDDVPMGLFRAEVNVTATAGI
jgi:hypothetical protein